NLTHLRESLLAHCPLRPEQVHAMPVESAELALASDQYAATLQKIAGTPAVLDLAHLGLGPDGHTASLVPGDPVLDVTDADVALTGFYQDRRRMTLTYPILDRSRRIVWLVTGREKAEMLARLSRADRSIPAGRISQHQAVVLADHEAAARLNREPPRPWRQIAETLGGHIDEYDDGRRPDDRHRARPARGQHHSHALDRRGRARQVGAPRSADGPGASRLHHLESRDALRSGGPDLAQP